MSLAGAFADARKSATRIYINNFADKGRQNTIDMLLVSDMDEALQHPNSHTVGSPSRTASCLPIRSRQ